MSRKEHKIHPVTIDEKLEMIVSRKTYRELIEELAQLRRFKTLTEVFVKKSHKYLGLEEHV